MRWLLLPTSAAVLVYLYGHMAAPVASAWEQAQASGDLVAEVDLKLKTSLTPARLDAELAAALTAEDEDLAQSLLDLADEQHLEVAQSQRDALTALRTRAPQRGWRDFVDGFVTGGRESNAALGGAVTADVTGFGDLRDLALEGGKVLHGGEADHLTIGLAAAGLALSVATWSSLGAALPARSGLSLIKVTHRAGTLSKPLSATLARLAVKAVDQDALRATLEAGGRLKLSGARQAASRTLRPAALSEFRQLGQSTATLYSRAGQRGTRQALALAQSPQELRNAARLATAKGSKVRGIFAVLGRGALTLAGLSMAAFGWLATFVGWLIGIALFARRLGLSLGRLVFRRKRRQATVAGAGSHSPTSTTARVAATCSPDSAKLARIPARL